VSNIAIRSADIKGAEVSWFAPICNGDTNLLGHLPNDLKSNWQNTSAIVKKADELGFRNILCPSSYQVGQDTLPFVAALSPMVKQMNLLAAVRCGEVHPPMLARTLATIDHILEGRLTVNIISSDLPGDQLDSLKRYQRSREVIEILKQAWTRDRIEFKGEYYNYNLSAEPVKPYQQNGGPLLYFGGYSPAGIELCAQHCDVYLLWPETKEILKKQMQVMSDRAAFHGREVDFGLRVHVIVRETEKEAKEWAAHLVSDLEDEQGKEIRNRAQDAKSLGVSLQSGLRDRSDAQGFAEPLLWTGIGRARSGCGAALVGSPEQIIERIQEYQEMGFRSFIFSGYPHLQECELFGRLVLPHLETISLPHIQNRVPKKSPLTPLAAGQRR
jgi:alkanesulfonate monooxygenase